MYCGTMVLWYCMVLRYVRLLSLIAAEPFFGDRNDVSDKPLQQSVSQLSARARTVLLQAACRCCYVHSAPLARSLQPVSLAACNARESERWLSCAVAVVTQSQRTPGWLGSQPAFPIVIRHCSVTHCMWRALHRLASLPLYVRR
jgi:hypothetical protein